MKKTTVILILVVFALIALIVVILSLRGENNEESDELKVIVSIVPQVGFVERIGGDRVDVSVMIPPGYSPESYDPSPEQIKKLAVADLYVMVGQLPFERAEMSELASLNKNMVIVDSSEGVELRSMEEHEHEGEGEHEDQHEETTADPHIWLAPELVKIQAQNIYEALVQARPAEQDYFKANLDNFLADLDSLDVKLKTSFTQMVGKTILVYHPAFGYLADAYGFTQEAIQVNGNDPSATQLKNIIDRAREENIKVVFVQQQFNTKSAEVVAKEIGGAVIQIDPLAEDYFLNLENMAQVIADSYSK